MLIVSNVIFGHFACPIFICKPNMVQIDQEMIEINLFVYFQDGHRPPLLICYFLVLDNP